VPASATCTKGPKSPPLAAVSAEENEPIANDKKNVGIKKNFITYRPCLWLGNAATNDTLKLLYVLFKVLF
jgi:hypothetical protein